MIIYNPLDGDPLSYPIESKPRECFLMTRLGASIPPEINEIRASITRLCIERDYHVIDATAAVTGRDFLLKIWTLVAATPLSVGICHQLLPKKTQLNIFYEIGVAQALGKETLIVKSKKAEIPSDFTRSEYVIFDDEFDENFLKYLDSVDAQAAHYITMAEQLDRNPLLAIDYLKRAFLITNDSKLKKKAKKLLKTSNIVDRAKNSVEFLIANF